MLDKCLLKTFLLLATRLPYKVINIRQALGSLEGYSRKTQFIYNPLLALGGQSPEPMLLSTPQSCTPWPWPWPWQCWSRLEERPEESTITKHMA